MTISGYFSVCRRPVDVNPFYIFDRVCCRLIGVEQGFGKGNRRGDCCHVYSHNICNISVLKGSDPIYFGCTEADDRIPDARRYPTMRLVPFLRDIPLVCRIAGVKFLICGEKLVPLPQMPSPARILGVNPVCRKRCFVKCGVVK